MVIVFREGRRPQGRQSGRSDNSACQPGRLALELTFVHRSHSIHLLKNELADGNPAYSTIRVGPSPASMDRGRSEVNLESEAGPEALPVDEESLKIDSGRGLREYAASRASDPLKPVPPGIGDR